MTVTIILPYLTMAIIDDAITNKNMNLLIKLISLYLVVTISQSISKVISDYIYSAIGKKVIFDLRMSVINHLYKLSGTYFTNTKVGELLTRIQSDISLIEEVATKMFFSIASDILMSIAMFVFLCTLQPDLLIIAVILQPLMLLVQKRYSKEVAANTAIFRDAFGKLSSVLQEFISAMMSIIMINGKRYFFSKYIKCERDFIKKGIKLEMTFSLNIAITNFISALITVAILGYGGFKVLVGTMSIGGLIAFNLYSQRLLSPIIRIAQSNMRIQQAFVAIDRIYEILDEPINISQNNFAYRPNIVKGDIKFENVCFSYNKGNNFIKNLNVEFERGKKTAIVGASGSGKTTIINLILRFWDVDSGCILLDGVDIKDYNLKFLRKNISVVSQDIFLFNDTILNNLILHDTNVTLEFVIECTKKADAYDYIMSLPDKFDTLVGERGVKLSGGQKQRLSIARALIRDTPIIILDEATSSVDNISERTIQEGLDRFLKGKTTIIIAHRLSTIREADLIYVLDKGNITEQGNHEQLINLNGVYSELYENESIGNCETRNE